MLTSKGNETMTHVHRPSLTEKLFFLISGIVVSVPVALFFEVYATTHLSNLFSELQTEILIIAILAPIIEEFAKAYPLFYRHGESQKSIFTLGFLVGLGFGITEFFEYVLILHVSPLVRLPGIFFHASTTSIIAYGIATKRAALFYLAAVLLHSSINLVAIFALAGLPYALLLTTTFSLCLILYTRTSEKMIDY